MAVGLGLLAVVLAVAAGVFVQQRVRDSGVRENLSLARAAGEAGQFEKAAGLLEQYLQRFPEDVSILDNYADVRASVELPRGDHLLRAIDARQRIVSLQPDHPENRLKLLRLYDQVAYSAEAIELADLLGLENPEVALIKAKQQARTRRFTEADLSLDRLLEADPLHLRGHELRLRLMQERNLPEDAFRRYGQQLESEHPDEPAAWTLAALAYSMIGDAPEAGALAERAADQLDGDPIRFELLLGVYNAIGRYDRATDLAEQALGNPTLSAVAASSVRRLWEARRYEAIATRLAERDGQKAASQLDGVAHLIWLSEHFVQSAEGSAEQLDFDSLPQSRRGELWASLLPFVTGTATASAEDAKQLVAALEEFPLDPHLHHYVGEVLLQQGATERAVQTLARAAQLSPTWSAPFMQLARALWLSGRGPLALGPAQTALRLDPGSPQAVEVFLTIAASNLDRFSQAQIANLASAMDQVDPGREVLSLAPLDVALAAQAGVPAGREALLRWLPALADATPPVLWSLLQVSQQYDLDRELAIVEARAKSEGVDPAVASLWAVAVADDEAPADGWALFEREAADREDLEWSLARARLAERFGRDEALSRWASLLERHGSEPSASRAILQSREAWTDPELIDRALERLSETAGDDDYAVRWAKVRRQLDGAQTARAQAEALSALSELSQEFSYLLEPQVRMAAAQAKAQNWTLAAQHSETAFRLAPYRWDLGLQAAVMLDRAGQREVATSRMRQAEASGLSGPAQAAAHAKQWLTWGDVGRARDLLSNVEPAEDPGSPLGRLQTLMAALSGDTSEVNRSVEAMIDLGELGATQAAVNVLVQLGQVDRLAELRENVGSRGLQEGEAALIRGTIDAALGNYAGSIGQLRLAMGSPELASQAWQQWLSQAFRADRPDRLEEAVDAASAASIGSSLLANLQEKRPIWSRFWEPAIRIALAEAAGGSTPGESLWNALDVYAAGRDGTEAWPRVAVELRQEAVTHPQSPSLHMMLIQAATAAGDLQLAAGYADEAASALPRNLQIRELQLRLNTTLRRWDRVTEIGEAIARLSPQTRAMGLLAQSEAWAQLNDGEAALAALNQLEEVADLNEADSLKLRFARTRAHMLRGDPPATVDSLRGLRSLPLEQQLGLIRVLSLTQASAAASAAWAADFERRIAGGAGLGGGAGDSESESPSAQAQLQLAVATWWRLLHERTSDTQHADEAARMLAELRTVPGVSEAALLMEGQLMEILGRDSEASDSYQALLAAVPNHAVAMNNLAMVHTRQNRGEEAVALAERLVQRAPTVALFQDTHATALLSAGRPEEAIVAASLAADLEPAQAFYRLTLGLALAEAGRTADAREALAQAERLAPARPVPALVRQFEALRDALMNAAGSEPTPTLGAAS